MWLTWLLMSATAHAGYQGSVIYSPVPPAAECGIQSTPTQSQVPVARKRISNAKRPATVKKPPAERRAKRVKKPPVVAAAAPSRKFCAVAAADQAKKWTAPEYPPMPKEQWQSALGYWPGAAIPATAPEPPTLWLLVPGLLALGMGRRK